MQECHTNFEGYKVTYKWNIHNFRDYIDVDNQKENISLRSTNFVSPPGKKGTFWIEMEITYAEDVEKKTVKCYLCWINIVEETKVRNTFCILNSRNKKCHVCTYLSTCTTGRNKSDGWGWDPYMKISELLTESSVLLPNGILTLQCDLIVYEGTPKSHDMRYVPEPYPSSLSRFKTLLDNQLHTDFTFHVRNEEFKVHKAFLIAQSAIFQAMFENEMAEKINNETEIIDIRPGIFKLFLQYIYASEIKDDMDYNDTIELLAAADKYQINSLKEKCYERLSTLINPENAVEIVLLGEKYDNCKLAEFAKNFIRVHNGGEDAFECLLKRLCNNCKISNAPASKENDGDECQDKTEHE